MSKEESAAFLRGWFKDFEMIQLLNGEEMGTLISILEFCKKDNSIDVLVEAIMHLDAESLSVWIDKVKEALDMGGEESDVFPNAIGYLLKMREEWENLKPEEDEIESET